MSYIVLSRHYSLSGEENYLLASTQLEDDLNIEIGEIVNIIPRYKTISLNKDETVEFRSTICKTCHAVTYGDFIYCPWCGTKYDFNPKKKTHKKKEDKDQKYEKQNNIQSTLLKLIAPYKTKEEKKNEDESERSE
jgi:hypothetical protein